MAQDMGKQEKDIAELERMTKELLDSLRLDFKTKLKSLKQAYEKERAKEFEESLKDLSKAFKTDKKDLRKSYKSNKRDAKDDLADARKKAAEDLDMTSARVNRILRDARKEIGTPYKYGGNGPSNFDCSGLVKHVYDKNGIKVPRVSRDQAKAGKKIDIRNAKPGDLIFFSHRGSRIDHVGIVVKNRGGKLEMIHASSSQGVILTDVNASSYWRPRLKKARRVT